MLLMLELILLLLLLGVLLVVETLTYATSMLKQLVLLLQA